MNILTDEKIDDVEKSFEHGWHHIEFARAIEAAVLSKLSEQAGEPFGYFYCYQGQDIYFSTEPQDATIPVTYYWQKRAYTEAQLIAAQQKAADALIEPMAKAIYKQWCFIPEYEAWIDGGNSIKQDEARRIARLVVESGEWREYL